MALLVQQLINGLSLGMMYALLALGFTMVYGIIQLINFAHFSVFVFGAFAALYVFEAFGLTALSEPLSGGPLAGTVLVALVVVMVSSGLLGVLIERICLRPLRGISGVTPMITTIGVSFILVNLLLFSRGPNVVAFPNILPDVRWQIGPVTYQFRELLVWSCSIVLMAGLNAFVRRTTLGKAMRATAADAEAAQMMGIEVNRVIALTFLLGSALAGAAGLMHGLYYRQIVFSMGFMAGMRAFTAAVLGGIGSIVGSVLGGLIIGVVEAISGHFIGLMWTDAVMFSVLILTLIFRPTGILGRWSHT